jgi:hypothetical protein
MCPCGLICSYFTLTFREEKPEGIAFTGDFYSIFRKKAFSLLTSVYFSIEMSNPKIFCIINLAHFQVYREKKVGKYLLPLSKKSSFYFSDILLRSDFLTRILEFFGPRITLNIFKNNISNQLDQGFRLVCELLYLVSKRKFFY